MMIRRFLPTLALTTFVLTLPAPSAHAQSPPRTITVSGQGTASSPPDLAVIQTGVVTQAASAEAALTANNEAMTRLLQVLQDQQIAPKDIQTAGFQVSPEYRQERVRGETTPQIVAYRVTNQVTVKVRNLPKLGGVLDALVRAGSNQISGISFSIDDPTGVMNQARNRAVADARSRAELYAQAADVRLGKVLSISEQPIHEPRPVYLGRAMAAEAAMAVPVATGEQEISATVFLVYALED